jgi:hypothetical protein
MDNMEVLTALNLQLIHILLLLQSCMIVKVIIEANLAPIVMTLSQYQIHMENTEANIRLKV